MIEYAEEKKTALSQEEFVVLESKMEELQNDLELNRKKLYR
jgi:hypothetical protein